MQPINAVTRTNRPLNILEVIGNASMGGMENYIKNFIQNLPVDEYKVTCICPYESAFTHLLRDSGVDQVYITPIADDPIWRSIQLTCEVTRLHQIDVIHAHMPKAHVLAGLAGCLVDKPVVATVHGMNVTSHELGITRAVGSHLITNCQEAYTQALAMGVSSDRVNLVRNGVDLKVFNPGNSRETLANAVNLPEGTPLVGFVGRLEQEKGPDLFLRAAEYVHHIRKDVHFVIVGKGSMMNRLQEMREQFHLQEHVHFIGWMDTADVYPSLDLLVHTSRSDGTSLVLLEAMACGCPTIGLAVGGVPEIIENDCTGILAGAGDWEAVGIRILELLDQPERMNAMGVAGRVRVEQQFDVKLNTLGAAEVLRKAAFPTVSTPRFNANTLIGEIGGKASANNLMG